MEPEDSVPYSQEPSTGPLARWIQLIPPHHILVRSILILTSHLRLGLPKGSHTPTASRQASRRQTKETKADVSIMTQTGVRRFS
jgi:hypothetical protein